VFRAEGLGKQGVKNTIKSRPSKNIHAEPPLYGGIQLILLPDGIFVLTDPSFRYGAGLPCRHNHHNNYNPLRVVQNYIIPLGFRLNNFPSLSFINQSSFRRTRICRF